MTKVEVLYGVTAVFVKLKTHESFGIHLQSGSVVQLDQAEALVLGVVALNRKAIVEKAGAAVRP